MVGKLIPDFFPKIFGPQQNEPLDADAVREAFASLAKDIGDGRSAEQVADGFIKIAVENMANAIKKISVQRGYDVTRYALNCFGGAGGQHACLVADALGMTSVLIHPLSSLLSAYGMGLADIRSVRQQAIEEPFGEKARETLQSVARRLARDAIAEVAGQGVATDENQAARARPYSLRGDRHAAHRGCRPRSCRHEGGSASSTPLAENEIRLRTRAQGALRLYRSQQGAGHRGRIGRGRRRRREVQGKGAQDHAREASARRRGARGFSPTANGIARWSIPATRWRRATR